MRHLVYILFFFYAALAVAQPVPPPPPRPALPAVIYRGVHPAQTTIFRSPVVTLPTARPAVPIVIPQTQGGPGTVRPAVPYPVQVQVRALDPAAGIILQAREQYGAQGGQIAAQVLADPQVGRLLNIAREHGSQISLESLRTLQQVGQLPQLLPPVPAQAPPSRVQMVQGQ